MPAIYTSPVAECAGNLDVADESIHDSNRRTPGKTIVSGSHDLERAPTNIKVIPRNVHSPKERRCRVVVGPTRIAIIRAVVVDAKMGPASRVRGIGGLVSAQALTTAAYVKEDSEPGLGWLVNRVTGSPRVFEKGL